MSLPELVAPAGSYEVMVAAFDHGADAVYAGLSHYNLRARAPNFSLEELEDALRYAHARAKRLYVTLNTMPTDEQMEGIEALLEGIERSGERPDALIVSDPGVMELCGKYLPDVPMHLSTQTGTFNTRSARFWMAHGIDRIVLPRELNLAQVTAIAETGVACELFVHGAMCVSISGRCLLGGYLSGRQANHGDCPQPCRYRYHIRPEGLTEQLEVEESDRGVYLLNSRDLNTIAILDRLVAAGVDALKIEGRNKSVHYVSTVVKVYRAALDRMAAHTGPYRPDSAWIDELERIEHRPYTTGFYTDDYRLQEPNSSKATARQRLVGVVKGTLKGHRVVLDVKNPFTAGEELDVLPVKAGTTSFTVRFHTLADFDGDPMRRALTNRLVVAESDKRLGIGDMVRRRMDTR